MDFLERFAERHRDRLVGVATTVRLARGEFLLRRGERSGDVFRVAEGELEVIDNRTQPIIVLDVIGRGGVVGEMSFLEDSVRNADVRTPDGAICQRWDRAALLRILDQEAAFAAEFYRVLAGMLVERNRATVSSAVAGGMGGTKIPRGPTNEVAAADGEALAEALRARFMERLGEGLARMSDEDGRIAGQVVTRELHPYTMRSHLGELALDRDAGTVGVRGAMAHLLANKPEGDGPLGEVLDGWLLGLPTCRGIRERGAFALQMVLEALPADPPLRLMVVNTTGGLVPGLLAQLGGRVPGEITCVDESRAALSTAEASGRARDLRLRLIQDDLVGLCMGRSTIRHAPQQIVVLDGLLEYLPERLAASLFRWARSVLVPGGTLIVTGLVPSPDDPVFRHVLAWPLVRLRTNALARLLQGAGFAEARTYEVATAGLVGVAR